VDTVYIATDSRAVLMNTLAYTKVYFTHCTQCQLQLHTANTERLH